MEEHFFHCPFCFTEVSILIDLSIEKQDYIEDCERCCNPIQFNVQTDKTKVVDVHVEPLEQ